MKQLIVIEGPTAVGKTDYSIELASSLNTDIISADSRQFFRELNVGVARPDDEQLKKVKHHFIAHISIHDYYSVSCFERDVLSLLEDLFRDKDVVVLCGGSGLYVNAVCYGIDELPDPKPEIRNKVNNIYLTEGIETLQDMLKNLDPDFYQQIDLHNPKRLCRAVEVCLQTGQPYSKLRTGVRKKRFFDLQRIALTREREELNTRINMRVDIMMENGLLDEAKRMHEYKHYNALNTVGYKELFRFIDNEISLEQAITDVKTNTRRFAKRQLTWLKSYPEIEWKKIST